MIMNCSFYMYEWYDIHIDIMFGQRIQCSELSANSIIMFVSGIIPAAISCG